MTRAQGNGSQLAHRPQTEILSPDGEAVDFREQPTALEAITRAEIDIQISTAKRYPRSMTKFLGEAKSMVAVDPDLAAQCTYWLPARQGSTEQVTGPSVRLSEIVAVCWGNLRVVGRITDDDGKFVTAQGVAIDLERNVGYSVEVRRGVTTRQGKRFGDDMIKVTCNAAIAIATRNAVFKTIPRAFVNLIEDEALRVARGDVKSLPARAAAALDWFAGKGVSPEQVFGLLGVGGEADLTLETLARLNGLRTAIKDGTSSVDEIFGAKPGAPAAEQPPNEGKADGLLRKLTSEPAPVTLPVTLPEPKGEPVAATAAPQAAPPEAAHKPDPASLGWAHGDDDRPTKKEAKDKPRRPREPGEEG